MKEGVGEEGEAMNLSCSGSTGNQTLTFAMTMTQIYKLYFSDSNITLILVGPFMVPINILGFLLFLSQLACV